MKQFAAHFPADKRNADAQMLKHLLLDARQFVLNVLIEIPCQRMREGEQKQVLAFVQDKQEASVKTN